MPILPKKSFPKKLSPRCSGPRARRLCAHPPAFHSSPVLYAPSRLRSPFPQCKHQLACLLAAALRMDRVRAVSDLEMAQLVEHAGELRELAES